jgi:DNA N-6-adenine-methyltransferase (Dam)
MSHWENSVGATDEWYTPPEVFGALGCTFDLDVAAPRLPTAVPARAFIHEESLTKQWRGFVWMNPPYGGRNEVRPWMDKFFDHGDGIGLTTDRTSAPWFWEAWARADRVLFTRKLRFMRPDGSRGVSPSQGSALWAAGPDGIAALERAAVAGFGILGEPRK